MIDEESDRLIAAFLDGTLTHEERDVLEKRLRESPELIARTAKAVRFDMALADAAGADPMELIEQKRVIIDRVSGQPLMVESTHRVGRPGVGGMLFFSERYRRLWWLLLPCVVVLTASGWWWGMHRASQSSHSTPSPAHPTDASVAMHWQSLPIRNPGFELQDLGSKPAVPGVLEDWDAEFRTQNVSLVSLPEGGAHGGKQVAMLAPGGHIKQWLKDDKGQPVLFEKGRQIRISGWVRQQNAVAPHPNALHVALHFVDEQKRLYVVSYNFVPIDGSGWRKFTMEAVVPEQEIFEAGYYPGPALNVRGRPILLSISNLSHQSSSAITFALDDMTVEEMPPPDQARHGAGR